MAASGHTGIKPWDWLTGVSACRPGMPAVGLPGVRFYAEEQFQFNSPGDRRRTLNTIVLLTSSDNDQTSDVNETCGTRDSKKFLRIKNFISRHREFQAAGLHVIFTIV